MTEQPDPGLDVTADPAGRQGAARASAEEHPCYGALLEGRLELIKCIGVGGTSAVYKALDCNQVTRYWLYVLRRRSRRHRITWLRFRELIDQWLPRPHRIEPADDARYPYIAVKVLNPRFRDDPERLTALQREVECCRQLVHPNIVRMYEFRRDSPTAYITMEFLRGQPLTAWMRSERFSGMSARRALPIINAVGQALGYAHSRGIVHCDFKPANVFLTEAGEVKLIDFGVARAFAEREYTAPEGDAAFKAVSPAYASAELLEGREPDPRDDVYGLACTAYELLTGVHPFGYGSAIEARKQSLTVERDEKLSYGQWQALSRALAFERAERTPSVKGFLKEFNAAFWRVKPPQVAVGAVACLLVAIGGVMDLLPSPELGLVGPGKGSIGAGTITESESKPRPARAPFASAHAAPPLAPEPADVIPSLTPVPSKTIKPETKATVFRAPGPRVASLLARAERQMAAKQLTTPVGDSAFESYKQVLNLIPRHRGALEGIARIKDEYKLWAEADKRRGKWNRAEASLKKALAVDLEDALLHVAGAWQVAKASGAGSSPRGTKPTADRASAPRSEP